MPTTQPQPSNRIIGAAEDQGEIIIRKEIATPSLTHQQSEKTDDTAGDISQQKEITTRSWNPQQSNGTDDAIGDRSEVVKRNETTIPFPGRQQIDETNETDVEQSEIVTKKQS